MKGWAEANGADRAAVRAEYLRGKAMGFYSDKFKHGVANEFEKMSNVELRAFVDE